MYNKLTIISFTNQGKRVFELAPMCYRNHAIKSVLDHFLILIKTPKRKRNAETFFQRELLHNYVFFVKINFYVQFLKLDFQGNDLNIRIK